MNLDHVMYVGPTSLKSHQQKEPLLLYSVPDMPWSTVVDDLMDLNGMQYLVLVDSYSGGFEICHLSGITSAMVIKKLKCQFSRFGSPENLITDNACQFSSREFASFIKEWDIVHNTMSTLYSQSNGLEERAVRSAKSVLEKCRRDESDIYMALLNLRNTPRDSKTKSPAEIDVALFEKHSANGEKTFTTANTNNKEVQHAIQHEKKKMHLFVTENKT